MSEAETKHPSAIGLDENRALMPKDSSELTRTLEQIAQGGGFPARFNTPAKRLAVYNLSVTLLKERWQLAAKCICEINGELVAYGDLPKALVHETGELENFKLFVIDDTYTEICLKNKNLLSPPFAAICMIQRKGHSLGEFYYTMEEAKNAGQYPGRAGGPWAKHTKIMLMRKAMNLAVRMIFPDALLIPSAEYTFDRAPDLEDNGFKDVTPKKTAIEEIYGPKEEANPEPGCAQ